MKAQNRNIKEMFTRKALPPLCYLLLATGVSSPLMAQTTGNEEENDPYADDVYVMEAFEVKGGFAGSLAAAAQKKELAPLLVEVLSAEDIGKLPDTSIAESLARLPGICTQRINGRAQIVSIRGLNEDFSSATLNGREQVTTGSARAVEFDQYPAELMAGAIIYKTGDASVVTQGIAGVVDLRTLRPLSYTERKVNFGAFYEWTQFDELIGGSERGGWRYNASYVDQFMDGKLGVAIGYAYNDKMGQGKQWNSWGYADYTDTVTGETNKVIGGAKPYVRSSELERTGLMATIEFKPSKTFHTTLDVYYTDFKEDQRLCGIELPLYSWGYNSLLGYGPSLDNSSYTTQDGVITSGTLSGVRGVMRNDIVSRDADIFSIGWNVELSDIAGWDLMFDASHCYIDRTDLVLESYSGTSLTGAYATDTMSFQMSDTGVVFSSDFDYSNADNIVLTSPAGWGSDVVTGGQLGYLKTPESHDEITQFRATAKRDAEMLWGFFNNVELGANNTHRGKYEYEKGYYLAAANGATEVAIPVATSTTDLSFIGLGSIVSYDPVAVLNSGVYEKISNPNSDVLAADWSMKENVTTLYAKLGIDKNLGRVPMTGSLGMQFVRAEQSSTGAVATGSGADGSLVSEIVTGEDSYWDFVPSLNLNFQLGEGRYLRISAARQLARQRMDYMRAGTQFGYDETKAASTDLNNSPWSGSGGNPELKPWEANSFDISLEQYFAQNMGYVALTGFFKDLKSYTYQKNTLTDFSSFASAVTGTNQPVLWEGYVSRWQNGDGGDLKGVEGTLSFAGEMFTQNLAGFGVIMSASYTDSSVSQDEGGHSPLPGLSDTVANATVYFERHGFSARVSTTYRSEYLATVSTFGPRNRTFRTADAETVMDAQISYTFESGPMKGISIIFQAYNLTNEPLSTYLDGNTLQVVDYQEYGRSYAVGMSYKF
ncbi:MAG: TonB-dependent receptor [Opitutales bacterium]|nr:TonB-dependent receptor [Opitutales bacterium]